MKIIDCHVHPWVEIRKGVYWGDIEKILDSARRNGISKICLSSPGNGRFQAYPTSKDVSLANDAVLSILDKYPRKTYGLCYLNPRYTKPSLNEISRCIIKGKMIGIKLWIACLASDKAVFPIAEAAQELGIPILQHAWNKSQGNLRYESRREINECPNIYVEISHMEGLDMLSNLLDLIGGKRILFGTHTPFFYARSAMLKIKEAASIIGRNRKDILAGNAERFLEVALERKGCRNNSEEDKR